MNISVKVPVMVREDNVGAIFIACNITTMLHTKYVEIRYKYVNEYLEDTKVKIMCVKSAENDYDILTNILSAKLLKKCSNKMIVRSLKMIPVLENFKLKGIL